VLNLIFPQFAVTEARSFLADWTKQLAQLCTLLLDFYANGLSDKEMLKLEESLTKVQECLGKCDIVMNNALSEPCYSSLNPNDLVPVAEKLKYLTQQALLGQSSIDTYRDWLSTEIQGDALNAPPEVQKDIDRIKNSLSNIRDTIVEHLSTRPSLASLKTTTSVETAFSADAESLEQKLIEGVCSFEFHQRTLIEKLYQVEAARFKPEEEAEWSFKTERILNVYSFNLAYEEVTTCWIALASLLGNRSTKRRLYIPFTKWIPFQMFRQFKTAFSRDRFMSNGKVTFGMIVSRLWSYMKLTDTIFALKAALSLVLFMLMFLSSDTKSFFTTYSLSGAIITILVVLSPTMGATYITALFELLGAVTGNLFAMATFYAFGNREYLLWISVVLIAFPGFHILITQPQFASIPLLLLISYSSVSISCWNQQFSRAPLEYSTVFGRIMAQFLIAVGWGVFFNLFVIPRFAKHELKKKVCSTIADLESLYIQVMDIPFESAAKLMEKGADEKSISEARSASVTSKQIQRAKALSGRIQLELLDLRMLVRLASVEPNFGPHFDASAYFKLLDCLEKCNTSLSSAQLALCEPWYMQGHVVALWMQIVHYLI
jgi:hypothetical protein